LISKTYIVDNVPLVLKPKSKMTNTASRLMLGPGAEVTCLRPSRLLNLRPNHGFVLHGQSLAGINIENIKIKKTTYGGNEESHGPSCRGRADVSLQKCR
jgi:hypothetical protein